MGSFGALQKRSPYVLGIAGFACLISLACNAASNQESDDEDTDTGEVPGRKTIVGQWRKVSSAECDQIYPDELEFLDSGIYLTPMREDVFKLWQSGDYALVDRRQIRIQSATDAMLGYDFSVSENGVLIFVDDDGCEVKYKRID